MTDVLPATHKRIYDLQERTAKFGEAIIKFTQHLPDDSIVRPIKSQLIRSGTSIGANYCEAADAESPRDFIHKIGICKKEANETKYWLRMVSAALPTHKEEAQKLWKETQELNLIFQKSIITAKNKLPTNHN